MDTLAAKCNGGRLRRRVEGGPGSFVDAKMLALDERGKEERTALARFHIGPRALSRLGCIDGHQRERTGHDAKLDSDDMSLYIHCIHLVSSSHQYSHPCLSNFSLCSHRPNCLHNCPRARPATHGHLPLDPPSHPSSSLRITSTLSSVTVNALISTIRVIESLPQARWITYTTGDCQP